VKFSIQTYGDQIVARNLQRFGKSAEHAEPALELVADEIRQIEVAVFSGQGRRGGGSWKFLSREWAARKARLGLDPRIMFATERLFRSMTRQGHPDQRVRISGTVLNFESRRPGAVAHQKGIAHMPRRQFIKFTEEDKRYMAKIIQRYLVERGRAKR
jgi:phage gpG-like protein